MLEEKAERSVVERDEPKRLKRRGRLCSASKIPSALFSLVFSLSFSSCTFDANLMLDSVLFSARSHFGFRSQGSIFTCGAFEASGRSGTHRAGAESLTGRRAVDVEGSNLKGSFRRR